MEKWQEIKAEAESDPTALIAKIENGTLGDYQVPVMYSNVHANEVAAFLMFLLEEREKLSKAIHAAKSGLDLDMDSEVGLNRQRQELTEVFRYMTTLRNSEKTIAGGGSGFRFNGEGNQVSYRCDATQVTTIDFDRNKIRGMATALSKKADEISMALDKCLVNTEVAYEAPFDINDSFEEILNDFIEKAAVA